MIIPQKITIKNEPENKNKLAEIISRLPGLKKSKIYSIIWTAGVESVLDKINGGGDVDRN